MGYWMDDVTMFAVNDLCIWFNRKPGYFYSKPDIIVSRLTDEDAKKHIRAIEPALLDGVAAARMYPSDQQERPWHISNFVFDC